MYRLLPAVQLSTVQKVRLKLLCKWGQYIKLTGDNVSLNVGRAIVSHDQRICIKFTNSLLWCSISFPCKLLCFPDIYDVTVQIRREGRRRVLLFHYDDPDWGSAIVAPYSSDGSRENNAGQYNIVSLDIVGRCYMLVLSSCWAVLCLSQCSMLMHCITSTSATAVTTRQRVHHPDVQ